MNEIILNLIVLAVLLVIGGGVYLLVHRKQAEAEQKIIQLATTNGWQYEQVRKPLSWGIRISSARWTLESLSISSGRESDSGSSNISMSTHWLADDPGSTLLIGERTSQADLGGFGDMLVRQTLSMALGADANGLTEVRVGNPAFQKRYMVWSQDTAKVGKVLTPQIESILLSWKGMSPLIKHTSAGLSIEIRGVRIKKAEDIQSLVNLGTTLLDAI